MSVTATRTSDGSGRSQFEFEREFALRLCEIVGSPVALGRALQLRNNEYADACAIQLDPCHYQEPKHFAEDYQVVEILKKSLNIPGFSDETRQSKALQKFLLAEERNAETNDRLWGTSPPEWFGEFSHQLLRILGPLDTAALTTVSELGKFGPGACVGVRSDGLVPSIKYEANPVATKRCSALIPGFMPEIVKAYKVGTIDKRRVVAGNRHFTVPKNFEIDRCAATEPLWNSFLQLGIGKYIEKRLKRFGVDLHDQRLNQQLACMAADWGLATIDLSSASDLMSRNLVVLALRFNNDPHGVRWLHLLDSARSHTMKIGEETRYLEMFSSMGNGFTFPLETAIFLALIRATVPRNDWTVCTAYGDDIVVPQRHAAQVIERLELLGFKVNSKKTCLAGVFFESCGTDWFNGHNVRPFYLHQEPNSPVPYPLQAANALRAWCLRIYGYLPSRYQPLWKWCKGQVPVAFRNPVPSVLGDVGLHTSLSEAVSSGVKCASTVHPGYEGYLIKYAMLRSVSLDRKSFGVLASALSSSVEVNCGKAVRRYQGWLRDYALSQRRAETKAPHYGLEPVRGLFGKVRTESAVVLWKDDFSWA